MPKIKPMSCMMLGKSSLVTDSKARTMSDWDIYRANMGPSGFPVLTAVFMKRQPITLMAEPSVPEMK